MYIAQRTVRLVQSGLKSYGPAAIKRLLWNKEYSTDKWNFADNTASDCVYSHLEKYARNGSILDLGCGSGNTSNELADNAYTRYVGVDISETCLEKARKRSETNGRSEKNFFASGDFLSYAPNEQFDVILFRESMYHVPIGKIKGTVIHYSRYLKEGGVFIVRMATCDEDGKPKARPLSMFEILRAEFEVLEDCRYPKRGATVVVFRAK